mmetsp:Transcript_79425/g.199580  ORF Transcript_79425/g.199580 Transcript_79425/m.199580 type:complete len:604 (-) Transcript_79425:41-1852(-)
MASPVGASASWSNSSIESDDDIETPIGHACAGQEMHDRIPAGKWCVRKFDLKCLRREVQRAIREGRIRPTERDPFDPEDSVYGPTFYTVNEQFIKPITAEAGCMSWALMKNPKGLQCDLFITHAWQEGIFEFLDKVLASWPPETKNAWCCMLANPQNLDISHLIKTPRSSPFAQALDSATKVLVVPNRHASIYTRLWCAYEAYLAYQWDKIILTASASPPGIKHVLVAWLAFVALGVMAGAVFAEFETGYASLVYDFTVYPLLVGSVLSSTHMWSRAVNRLGTWWSAYNIMLLIRLRDQPSAFGFTDFLDDQSWRLWRDAELVSSLTSVIFFGMSEVDRIWSMIDVQEAEMLRAGFSGSISDACCTSPADAESIRAEIGDDVGKVDGTVQQLIRAGMSTSSLRLAAEAGVEVERFTSLGYAFAVLVGTESVPYEVLLHSTDSVVLDGFSAMSSTFAILSFIFWTRSPLDSKIFAYLVLQKVVLLVQRPPHMLLKALWRHGSIDLATMLVGDAVSEDIMWALVLALSIAGIHRIARIPLIGRRLAQFLVARGRSGVRKAFFGEHYEAQGYRASSKREDEQSLSSDEDDASVSLEAGDSDSTSPA